MSVGPDRLSAQNKLFRSRFGAKLINNYKDSFLAITKYPPVKVIRTSANCFQHLKIKSGEPASHFVLTFRIQKIQIVAKTVAAEGQSISILSFTIQ